MCVTCVSSFFIISNMPSTVYKKTKEQIALAVQIKNLKKEADPCSRYC